jgi:hypothetical protein
MPRNGSGTYVLPAGQPVTSGTTISSATFNTLTSDLSTAITSSIATDGQSNVTANIPMSNHKLTGLSAGSASGDSARYDELILRTDSATLASSTGTTLIGWLRTATSAVLTTLKNLLEWQEYNVFEFMTSAQIADVQAGTLLIDVSSAVQAALNAATGKKLVFPAGNYLIGSKLTIYSKTKIRGFGIGVTTFTLSSGFSASSEMLINATQSGSVDTYYDTGMAIEDLSFDGNSNTLRTIALVSFFKAQKSRIERCSFKNNTYQGIAIGGCNAFRISECEFSGLGKTIATTEGGSAIWTGRSGDTSLCKDIDVLSCLFEGNRWSAIYFSTNGGRFHGNVCNNNYESTLYMNPDGTNISIKDNRINGTTMKTVAAAGLEIWGTNIVIADNDISRCAKDGIVLGDCQRVEVKGNRIHENGIDTVAYPVSAGIAMISNPFSSGLSSGVAPSLIDIHDNFIYDLQGTKTQKYAIQGYQFSGGTPSQITISNNNFFQEGVGTFRWDTGFWGSDCVIRSNILSNGKIQPAFVRYNQAGLAAPGTLAITGLGFRPTAVQIEAVIGGSTSVITSLGSYDGATQLCTYTTAAAAGYTCSAVGGQVLQTRTPANVITNSATCAFDADGLTLTFTTASVQCNMFLSIYS